MGRASRKSPVKMYQELEPKGSKWHLHGYLCMIGNYLLMMYYTTVAGWMLQYFVRTAMGSFQNLDADQVAGAFTGGLANPLIQVGCMAIVVVLGFWVNSQGLQNGLEKVTKVMMIALLVIMVILAVNSIFLPGAGEGLRFYLLPSMERASPRSRYFPGYCKRDEPGVLHSQYRNRLHGDLRKLYRARPDSDG